MKQSPEDIPEAISKGRTNLVESIMHEYQIKSVSDIISPEAKEVTLFKREFHNTNLWNPLHFAIYNGKLSTVKKFLEDLGENHRLATRLRSENSDYTSADNEIFPLCIACSNKDMGMFSYFWEQHYMWDSSHLFSLLETIFTKTQWNEALMYVLKAQTTEDIFYTLNFEERELFIEELFRRYVQNAEEEMTEGIYEILLATPYAIITIKGFLTAGSVDKKKSKIQKANEKMVKRCTAGISAFDYGDLMFNASEEYRNKWLVALDDFKDSSSKAQGNGEALERKFDSYKMQLGSSPIFASQDTYKKSWDDLKNTIKRGDMVRIRKYIEELNIHGLKRSPLPINIKIEGVPHELGDWYWNSLLQAINYGQLECVEFLMDECRINIRASICLTTSPDEKPDMLDS